MARAARHDIAGVFHHLTNRGNRGDDIFRDDDDRRTFLRHLAEAVAAHRWRCHGYCLMANHYHLLLETPEATLSDGMRWLSSVTTQRFNRRHGLGGHLYQGRFKSVVVERDSHFLEALRYIALNPVRAGLVARADAWPWSHHRALTGAAPAPDFLAEDWILEQFAPAPAEARRRYGDFVAEGGRGRADWPPPVARRGRPPGAMRRAETAVARNSAKADELRAMAGAAGAAGRDRAWMAKAHFEHGHGRAAIARAAGLHRSTVSRILNQFRPPS